MGGETGWEEGEGSLGPAQTPGGIIRAGTAFSSGGAAGGPGAGTAACPAHQVSPESCQEGPVGPAQRAGKARGRAAGQEGLLTRPGCGHRADAWRPWCSWSLSSSRPPFKPYRLLVPR